jgi:hypothetical protein
MPRIDDKLEPILADLDACEQDARDTIEAAKIDPIRGFVGKDKELDSMLAMARIVVALRPLLDQANELAAELEVALVQNARIEPLEARVAELEDAIAITRNSRESNFSARISAEDERDAYRDMLEEVLASAAPNERDHPCMSKAWKRARELLKNGPVFTDEKPFAAGHETTCIACADPVVVGDTVRLYEEGYRHDVCPRDRKATHRCGVCLDGAAPCPVIEPPGVTKWTCLACGRIVGSGKGVNDVDPDDSQWRDTWESKR